MLKNKLIGPWEKYYRVLFFIGSLLFSVPYLAQAQCVPTGATILSSGDDNTSFWVDGNLIPVTSAYCQPPCVPTPIVIPGSDFTASLGSTVVFAAATTNVNPSLVFSSYEMEISCQGGGDVVINSSGVTGFYWDPNGGGGSCGPAATPANDPGGNTWYDSTYNPTSNPFSNSSAVVVGTTYVTQVFDPITGAVLPFLSYNSSASANSCGVLYWRQGEVLPTPQPTLGPTNVTVTNTLIAGSVTENGNQLYASYAVTVCNSGAPIQSVPVTLTDYFSNDMQGNSTGCPGSPFPQSPQYQCGTPYQVIYPTGLPGGGACESVTVNITNYYYPNDYCDPVTAIAIADWAAAAAPVSSNVVTFSIPCAGTPTPTNTPTSTTPGPTPTNTLSPTPPACGAYSGPLLNLEVENNNDPCTGNQMTMNYQIYNWGTTPISLANLNIVMYVNTGPYAVDLNGAYSPYFYSPTGTQENSYTTTMSYQSLGTTITCNGKVYNGVVTLSFSTGSQTTIDPNGGYASTSGDVQMNLNGYPGQNFDATCDAYSDYAPGVFRNDSGYVLLNGGSLVQEATNGAGTIDPNSGQIPCVTSFVTCTPTPTTGSPNTPTPTNTFTNSPTNTVTNTATNTPTPTSTNTVTNTVTPTNTPTNTGTLPPTSTPTNSPTVTNTNTVTNTPTNSPTNTVTNTPTWTPTATPSPTPVAVVSMAKNVSETTAKIGDTLTYSIGITVAGLSANNVVVTDILPTGLTFAGYGSAPAGTTTSPTAPNLKWSLPSPLAVGSYQLTYQAQVNQSVPGAAVTNNAQLTYSGGATITSSVPVQLSGLDTVVINIYNSAGEVVKTLQTLEISEPVNGITLQPGNQITTLQGPGSTIQIFYNGTLIGTWDGSNNSGNPVTNGTYEIKVGSISNSGVETNVSLSATVNRQLSNITANIYNSAGELIRTLYSVVSDSFNAQMTNVSLSSSAISPGSGTNGNSGGLTIIVNTSATPVTLTWDGTNNLSTIVSPGSYTVQLHWDNGQSSTTDISRTVLVVPASGSNGTVMAEPNVLEPGTTLTTTFTATGITNAWTVSAKIYTIAGQLVAPVAGTPGTATAQWTASGMASGIYFAVVEVQNVNGGVIERQTLKLLVLH